MGAKDDCIIQLKESQLEYLRKMAAEHNLPDESKAVRCLV